MECTCLPFEECGPERNAARIAVDVAQQKWGTQTGHDEYTFAHSAHMRKILEAKAAETAAAWGEYETAKRARALVGGLLNKNRAEYTPRVRELRARARKTEADFRARYASNRLSKHRIVVPNETLFMAKAAAEARLARAEVRLAQARLPCSACRGFASEEESASDSDDTIESAEE